MWIKEDTVLIKNKPKNISEKAQLLKGVGASSWFEISLENEKYRNNEFDYAYDAFVNPRFGINWNISGNNGFQSDFKYEV